MENGKVTYKNKGEYYRVRIGIGNKKAYESKCFSELDAKNEAKFLRDELKDGVEIEQLIKSLKKTGVDYYLVDTKK
ncbi:MAG: hypothetical protein LLG02_08155 [Pelosinus sp.]|nr:hypothetical protein [Pelosinus sp.]